MARLRTFVALALATTTAAGCTASTGARRPHDARPPSAGPPITTSLHDTLGRVVPRGLVHSSDCPRLLDALRRQALRQVTPYGLGGRYGDIVLMDGVLDGVSAPAPGSLTGSGVARTAAGIAAAGGKSLEGFSTTNVQEAGVDEPDTAKTDGETLALLRGGPRGTILHLVDVAGAEPRLLSRLHLPHISDGQLLLVGDRVVVFGSANVRPVGIDTGRISHDALYAGWPQDTQVVVVDVSDRLSPMRLRHYRVPGYLVDARLLGGRVVTVTQASPRLRFDPPPGRGRAARHAARAANRASVASATFDDFVPPVTGGPGRSWDAPCGSVYRPHRSAGLGTVSVTSIDPATDAAPHRATVVADAGVVYASPGALYVATTSWSDALPARTRPSTTVSTRIHAFDLTDPDRPEYAASGRVSGSVLDKYALSEQDGYLRVATTTEPGRGAGDKRSDNVVTVLQPRQGRLVEVGRVAGLGRGERIQSVRFLGELGYVVTYRQTDPLYVLDLADPAEPIVRGDLKVTGYSAYLHPLGDGQLFGLGRTVNARSVETGVQASVFDVSDTTRPALVDRLDWPGGWSPAQEDPHQFLWWPQKRLAVIPLEQYTRKAGRTGDVVLHVSDDGELAELGEIRHPGARSDWRAQIDRAIVVGDVLYTVSSEGVLASDLESLAVRTWLPFD
jgi:uncharacterized secreted protein with C-terminal beta-propeller domain